MKSFVLNHEKSRTLYDSLKANIKPKNCYMNIFNVLLAFPKAFHSGEWKIAYGYVSSIDGVYCRHCFILAGEDVIDPTVFTANRDGDNRHYYVTKVFESMKEYLDALDAEDNHPGLLRYLRDADASAQEWATQNGYLFIG